VLATDISTLHPEGVAAPNLEVRRHDILADPLPDNHFDLAHARLVVEDLGRRALERATAAVRPGGWVLLEDHECGAALSHPDGERYRRVSDAISAYMAAAVGYDASYGRRLVHELDAAGLQEVGAAGQIRIYRGGTSTTTFTRLTIEAMGAGLMASGELVPEDLEWLPRALDDPDSVFLTPCIAAWGRKR
jgi:hypothetical protein